MNLPTFDLTIPTPDLFHILNGLLKSADLAEQDGNINRADYCHTLWYRLAKAIDINLDEHSIRFDLDMADVICTGCTSLAIELYETATADGPDQATINEDNWRTILTCVEVNRLAHLFAAAIVNVTLPKRTEETA